MRVNYYDDEEFEKKTKEKYPGLGSLKPLQMPLPPTPPKPKIDRSEYLQEEISKMAQKFTQINKTIQMLDGKLARLSREMEDMLFNLDDDNFSEILLKEKDKMKTEIKINEEGIQAEITDRTNADVTLQSNITATADRLTTEVKRLDGDIATAESNMSQTADEIKTEVRKVYAIKEYSGTGQPPSTSSHEYIWKSTSTGKYYIFNEITNRWIETTKNDIKTAFIQTADGFKFDGTVKINGDLITGGTISGVNIDVTTDVNVGRKISLMDGNVEEASISIYSGSTPTLSIRAEGSRDIAIGDKDFTHFESRSTTTYVRGEKELRLGSGNANGVLVNGGVVADRTWVNEQVANLKSWVISNFQPKT